ncbi:MAG: radical SAM protein [Clostridia bacterium]|nr:radical SAM protein [Clostridia bacterium]
MALPLTNEAKSTQTAHLRELAAYRRSILPHPPLRNLFLELTRRCNEHCLHCGSRCGESDASRLTDELTTAQYKALLDSVKAEFADHLPELDVTGGEPLLRTDFFDIMGYAHALGFRWGMTSNAILIDGKTARRLRECGMKTISVSIDGLPATHDAFRNRQGAYDAAMRGIQALIEVGGFQHIQVTTVVTRRSLSELSALFEIMKALEIQSWRVISMEPIGRATQHPELLLSPDEYRRLFDFIRDKRTEGWPLTYGCSHFLGSDYERQVRKWYFLCNAGIYTASIMSNGDIGACLDIERRPELIQGNILRDSLRDVWENRFSVFRADLSERNKTCMACDASEFCHGGAHHSWDYDQNRQQVCFKGILF